MADDSNDTKPSFEKDIMPLLEPYKGAMLWRLDLTDYSHVKANADLLYTRLTDEGDPMPPVEMGGPQEIIARRFKAWMDAGCPP